METIWFCVVAVMIAMYVVLDGFDLGVGILHMGVRTDQERRILMNSIGPLWDGNEVWLVVFGGALFAAFPNAYAAAFSGFFATSDSIFVTTPAPTVLPPSRIAKRRPSSHAIGETSSTSTLMLSPGITISVPAGSVTVPVTSVVRK